MATCKDCICSEVCYYKAFNDEKHLKKRRDDVEKICKSFVHRDRLKNAPTVDAVPVVRCKDCEHYEADRVGIPGGDPRRVYECGYCYHWKYEAGDSPSSVDADDFCSYGERRTNES